MTEDPTLVIPERISSEGFTPFLEQLAVRSETPAVNLDFSILKRISPAGLVAIAVFDRFRKRRNLLTTVSGLEQCWIVNYLRRMDLLRQCDWEWEQEPFRRHDSRAKFVPLEEIGHDTASLGNKIAECIAPGGEEFGNEHANQYDTAWYLITELANNVRQHSRGLGFISAQRTISDGFVKLAFGDCGCGIPTSLRDALPDSTRDLPDEDVIEKALVARISSKGPPANQGVGLTLSARIVSLMDGSLLIASGNGIVVRQPAVISVKRNLLGGGRFPGTLIAITFPFDGASDFNGKLLKAKELEKLLPSSPRSVSFQA